MHLSVLPGNRFTYLNTHKSLYNDLLRNKGIKLIMFLTYAMKVIIMKPEKSFTYRLFLKSWEFSIPAPVRNAFHTATINL